MFTPNRRYILFASLLAPLTLFVPLSSAVLVGVLLGYAALILFAAYDLLISRHRLNTLSVQATSPLRISKDNEGSVQLFIKREGTHPKLITVGLPFPDGIEAEDATKTVTLKGENKTWSLNWTCTATQRGIFKIQHLYSECESQAGFWTLRRTFSIDLEIRVYPNLRRDQNQLANLFLNRGLAGIHHQRMIGKGREYDRLREYVPGDSILDLHWKASAKRNSLVTKTYQIERTQEIYILIDHSRLSSRQLNGGSTDTVLERFVTAASVLGLAAERSGDLFGLITFSHQINRFVRASSGRHHQQAIQDALFGLTSESVPPDYDELLTFIRLRLRRRALLIILTDLSDPAVADAFCQRIPLITNQHHVLVNMLQEEDVAPLFQDDRQANSTADIYQHLAGHLRWQDLRERQLTLRRMGIDLKMLPQEKLTVEIVNQYIGVKQKQLL